MQKESNQEECYPLHMNHLADYFYQKARKELNETPESRESELKKLRDLLSADKVTNDVEFEEDFLHLFLRHSKYNALRAFRGLQKYLNFRRHHISVFESIPDEHFKGNSTKFASILPYRCPDGCVIIYADLSKWDPNELPFEYLKRYNMGVFLQSLRSPMTQINGFKVIYDFKDTLKHMRFCTPQNIFLLYNAAFNCVPARYKEAHFINKNAALTAVWAVLKYVVSEKLRKRVFFHSKPEDLLNHFPSSLIPVQYGGSLVNFHDAELMAKVNEEHGNHPEGGQPNYF